MQKFPSGGYSPEPGESLRRTQQLGDVDSFSKALRVIWTQEVQSHWLAIQAAALMAKTKSTRLPFPEAASSLEAEYSPGCRFFCVSPAPQRRQQLLSVPDGVAATTVVAGTAAACKFVEGRTS